MSILDEHIEPRISINLNDPWFKAMGFVTLGHDLYGKIYMMRRSFTFHHEIEIHVREGNGYIKYVDSSSGIIHSIIDTNPYTDLESFQSAILKAIKDYGNFEGPFFGNKNQPHKSKIRRFLERWLGFPGCPKGT